VLKQGNFTRWKEQHRQSIRNELQSPFPMSPAPFRANGKQVEELRLKLSLRRRQRRGKFFLV